MFAVRSRVYRTLRSLTLLSSSAILLSFALPAQADDPEEEEDPEEVLSQIKRIGDFEKWNDFYIDTSKGKTLVDPQGTNYLYFTWKQDDNTKLYSLSISDEAPPTDNGRTFKIGYTARFGATGGDNYFLYDWLNLGDDSPTTGSFKKGVPKEGENHAFTILGGKEGGGKNFVVAQGETGNVASTSTIAYHAYSQGEKYDQDYDYDSEQDSNKKGRGGAAMFLGTDAKMDGTKVLDGADWGEIVASFFYNGFKNSDRNDHGGAVYISYGAQVSKFSGYFVSNSISTSKKSFGGAIYNLGTIDEISGTFIFNNVTSTGTSTANGGAISNGGETNLINGTNYAKEAHIGTIGGYFIGNYVKQANTINDAPFTDFSGESQTRSTGYDSIGGAIVNYGHIDKVDGVFIGNHAVAGRTANSGVIRNYDREGARAIIGPISDPDNPEEASVVFDGIFIGNYAQGGTGDASGGVMRNNGNINGNISGLYVGNYAKTEGLRALPCNMQKFLPDYALPTTKSQANKRPNEASEYQYGTYNFVRHSFDGDNDPTPAFSLERRGMAYGGVFYNDVKTENIDKTRPTIGNINATFVDNYVYSTYGEAHGGAIFNQDSVIQEVNGTFSGNSATSVAFAARGGAIFNNTSGYFEDWSGKMAQLGENGTPAQFVANYAQGKLAQGGAVYVSNSSLIDTIYADFTNNITRSEVDIDSDTEYYHNVVSSPEEYDPEKVDIYYAKLSEKKREAIKKTLQTVYFKGYTLYPAAQGGALYVDERGRTKDITGSFTGNIAEVNAVGNLTWGDAEYTTTDEAGNDLKANHNDTDSFNENALAQGGAIYVNQGYTEHKDDWGTDDPLIFYNIRNLKADFTKNQASSVAGVKEGLTQASEYVQGGAIYVNHEGTILSITGNFIENEAKSEASGYVEKIVQGGAIYVNEDGFIGDITAGDEVAITIDEEEYRGFVGNKAWNSGESSNEETLKTGEPSKSTIKTGGGAIYVSEDGKIRNIEADFVNNEAYSSAKDATDAEYMRGGAILVNAGGEIQDIGAKNHVSFVNNRAGVSLDYKDTFSGELEYARGGAIFVSSHLIDGKDDAGNPNVLPEDYAIDDGRVEDVLNQSQLGKIHNIWADFKGNGAVTKASVEETETKPVTMKAYAQGGAIFVLNYGEINDINGDFTSNYAITREVQHEEEQTDTVATGALEWAHGGAIDVAIGGKINDITGKFSFNRVENSGHEATHIYNKYGNDRVPVVKPENDEDPFTDVRDSDDMHAKGGAIYIAKGAKVNNIFADFEGNLALGSGQVRAGALFVSRADILEVRGNFIGNVAYSTNTPNEYTTPDETTYLQSPLTYKGKPSSEESPRFETPQLTYGGAIRFDQSTLLRLDKGKDWKAGDGKRTVPQFYLNRTNGSGGAISLTNEGHIYRITADFIANEAGLYGGAVHNLGDIGQRGAVLSKEDGKVISLDEATIKDLNEDGTLSMKRDATNYVLQNPNSVEDFGTNKAGRYEYDGTFTGGFVNSNFLYNTVDGITYNKGERGKGGAIYTDKDLFITASGEEVVMSGNVVRFKDNGEEKTLRSAIYVDNVLNNPSDVPQTESLGENADYTNIIIYLVAQENGILRIDDNIRGQEEEETEGFVLRLRGYTNRGERHQDQSGLIVLNNRVEDSYSVMDDVTLYIGYAVRTYQNESFLETYGDYLDLYNKEYNGYCVGDEDKDVVRQKKDGTEEHSVYLNSAGTIVNRGEIKNRSQLDGYHQSDVFRDSHLSVRSGTVALTDTTYASKQSALAKEKDKPKGTSETSKAYTEYLFASLIAYGVDYNYGVYGANAKANGKWDQVREGYKEEIGNYNIIGDYLSKDLFDSDGDFDVDKYLDWVENHNSGLWADPTGKKIGKIGREKVYDPKTGGWSDGTLFAKFEFDIGLDKKDLYSFALTDKYYYKDGFGGYTEEATDKDGKPREEYLDEDNERVRVVRQMAPSDVLTVCVVVKDDPDWEKGDPLELDWSQTPKGRVTLNGLTINMLNDGWKSVRYVKGGMDPGGSAENPEDNYNLDVYVQLINFVLVNEERRPIDDSDKINEFRERMAAATREDDKGEYDPKSFWNLLRLSDHFDRVDKATAVMKGSDILADQIELATTWTIDDSIHLVNWRDHLAEWAEAELSTKEPSKDGEENFSYSQYDGKEYNAENDDTAKHEDGQKIFYLDQSVYYLNRNINIRPNPTEKNHDPVSDVMWGKHLALVGTQKHYILDLQHLNMLSHIAKGQDVRLRNFTLEHVALYDEKLFNNNDGLERDRGYMRNEGHLTLDSMVMPDGNAGDWLTINNAGSRGDAKLTLTGIMDIDFKITTKNPIQDGQYGRNTNGYGVLTIDDSSQVADVQQSYIHINRNGIVEHQDITHNGDSIEAGGMILTKTDKTYRDAPAYGSQVLGTWSIDEATRDTFTSNTYLPTTWQDDKGEYTIATDQFKAFQDNSLTMNGGAFNLGHMYTHRLKLRYFNLCGGAVFVDSSTIQLNPGHGTSYMGGIDAYKSQDAYAGSKDYSGTVGDDEDTAVKPAPDTTDTPDTPAQTDANTTHAPGKEIDKGLIWLQNFVLKGTSDQKVIHVKFVDDQVGLAVKDSMGVANGSEESGKRYMADGDYIFIWEVSYNNTTLPDDQGEHAVTGYYTLRRVGPTAEAVVPRVSDLTGSFVSMMQVYNYSFQHADLYSANINNARLARHYANVMPAKGKDSIATSCPPSTVGIRGGLWMNTYSSSEDMPLRNGPTVKTQMYGGLVGGDTDLREHSNGWASVYSLYGGYIGSTQKYETVKIKQNGAAVGATATFYKKNFYAAVTASIGTSAAESTGRGGSEDSHILMGGVASRFGYNINFDNGRYVLQPTLQVSYSCFHVNKYTNATGAKMDADPTTVLQFHPYLKLIKNTDCTWSPYGTIGYAFHYFGSSSFTVNGIEMPSMSIKPYLEYSVGAQRTYADRYTVYGQLTGRNGGRQGFEAAAGLRVAW